jgi:group I intron endonuclease
MGYIYKIINKINGQLYIGQTTKSLEERWRKHKTTRSNCRYLKNAFNKYGLENFDFKLVCICFDEDLNRFEIDYIKKYDSLVPKGYNLRAGGENGGKHNDETKLKISNSLKNRIDIVRTSHQLGKAHTEEIKNKISKALIGIKQKPESIQKRREQLIKHRVFKYDNYNNIIEEFNGYTAAAKSLGINKNLIWKACNEKTKTCKGFIWKSELKN